MEAASLSAPGRSPFSISPPTPDSYPCRFLLPARSCPPDGTAARPRPRRTPGSTGRITGGRPNPSGGSQGRGRRVQSSRVPRFLADVLVDVRVMSCRGAHLSRRLPRIPPGPRAAPRRGRRAVTCSPAAPRIPVPGFAGEAGSSGRPSHSPADAGAAHLRVSVGGAGHTHAHAARHTAVAGTEKTGRRRDGCGGGSG